MEHDPRLSAPSRLTLRRWTAGLALAVCLSAPSLAAAELPAADVAAARAAYAEATAAHRAGEHARAAELFARADELAPNPVALEAAIRAAIRADEPVLGTALVQRARSRETEGSLAAAIAEAREAFRDRLGRLQIHCPACTGVSIDGAPAAQGRPERVEVGLHVVEMRWRGGDERRMIRVDPGKTARVEPRQPAVTTPAAAPPGRAERAPAPPASPASPPAGRGFLSPTWFWASAGVTAALGIATAVSAADTAQRHQLYAQQPSLEGAAAGRAAQARTHYLLAGSLGALGATAAVGLLAVRWGGPRAPLTGSIQPSPLGASASVSGRF